MYAWIFTDCDRKHKRGDVPMKPKNNDRLKYYYPSQIGYRPLNSRVNIARKMLESFYPEGD